ncbi:DUF5412 family protein [Paenibacillus popilliae]|uniref:Uncharacterized protein n=1 Tax=Paenibacillus popilliae ATCC 14706 TaxID=1212764 RepID=M9M1K5_PAEPP|nr:DUF5412 family protein [Paenibacillus popilliae]GAC42789.1 hypothetical protein PPOP_2149 [Paenibacillus popilliae ATCC 14706]
MLKKGIMIAVIMIALIWIGIKGFNYYFFECMSCLPKGEFLQEVTSQDKQHSLKAYLVNEHSTTPYAIRVELMELRTKKTKTIYWNFPQRTVEMKWKDKDTIDISGIVLNIENGDIYNKRIVKNQAC